MNRAMVVCSQKISGKGDTMTMKRIRFTLTIALLMISALSLSASEAGITGTWKGNLKVGAQTLPLVFHIQGDDSGGGHATMDSPKQQAYGIPVNEVTFKDGVLTLVSDAVHGTFSGKINSVGQLEGQWKQGGQSFSLTLDRSKAKPARPTKSDKQEIKSITELFQRDGSVADLFQGAFLEKVPETEVVKIVKKYKKSLGTLKSVKGRHGSYTLLFEKGQAPCKISLADNGLIQGLWLGNYTLTYANPDQVLNKLKALNADVAYTITRNNVPIKQFRSDRHMAVGSTFKLFILRTLTDQIQAGKLSWDSTIPINPEYKSLPSGMLQKWPDGTPMTLESLAHLMISISDNTAADHLLHFLGRKTVERIAPETMRPFLSTSEVFRLKWSGRGDLLQAYVKGDTAARREILTRLPAISLNSLHIDMSRPIHMDVLEWQVSTDRLCKLIYSLRDNPSLTINPGLASPDIWHKIGFKGGSDVGVLNYTHVLQKTQDSPIFCVSATLNMPEKVDAALTKEFTQCVTDLIAALARLN
jgi:beta-lactamase class A